MEKRLASELEEVSPLEDNNSGSVRRKSLLGNRSQGTLPNHNNRYSGGGSGGSTGLVVAGSSQLNNRLGKAKSKADLFSEFRARLGKGETAQDFISKHKLVLAEDELRNLEEAIKESFIEGTVESMPSSARRGASRSNSNRSLSLELAHIDAKMHRATPGESHLLEELFGNKE